MIVPMKKVSLIVMEKDGEAFLRELREAGVVHPQRKRVPSTYLSRLLGLQDLNRKAMGVLNRYTTKDKDAKPLASIVSADTNITNNNDYAFFFKRNKENDGQTPSPAPAPSASPTAPMSAPSKSPSTPSTAPIPAPAPTQPTSSSSNIHDGYAESTHSIDNYLTGNNAVDDHSNINYNTADDHSNINYNAVNQQPHNITRSLFDDSNQLNQRQQSEPPAKPVPAKQSATAAARPMK